MSLDLNMSVLGNGLQYFSSFFSNPAGPQYHGLINQGATCYLNSVLQVLFMTKDFREAVKRYSSENPSNEENIDGLLSAMFEVLKNKTAKTNAITKRLGIQRVYEQQDAAEYFERILQLTSQEASQIFHGGMSHRTTCHECLKEADADGPFWYLPLALMDFPGDVYSVVDGVEQFFWASEFRGENQMYCDGCDDKVDASTRYVIKHHPDVLMLLLKRFDFSYSHMSYVKINCAVNVPLILQIPESQTYELYAVVDHAGDLRAGHYNATIRSEDDGRWYWFDDTSVKVLYNQPFQAENTKLSQAAYLLFYRKKKSTAGHDIMEVCTNRAVPVTPSDNSDPGQDAENGGEREEEGSEESISTGVISVGSDEVRQRGPHSHQDSDGGQTGHVNEDNEDKTEQETCATQTEHEDGSKHKELLVKIVEEEFLITPCGEIKLVKTEIIEERTLRATLGAENNEGNDDSTCSDPKQLSTNSQEENKTVCSNANKFYSESDVQVETAVKKTSKQKRRLSLKQRRKKKKKAARQFLFVWKRWKGSQSGKKSKCNSTNT